MPHNGIDADWNNAIPVDHYAGAPGAEIIHPTAWGNRDKLPRELPEAPSLPPELLPPALRPWLQDVSSRAQIPIEYIAAPTIVALSSLIGRSMGIYPKQRDDWLVIPNLWGAIIGRPGVLKSPAVAEAVKPLRRLATEASEDFKTENAQAEARQQINKLMADAIAGKAKSAAKNNDTAKLTEYEAELSQMNIDAAEAEIHERRYIITDGTVEKIGELLNQNPRGLLLARDELSGWLRNLDKSGREGDREFFLEAWNGSGGYSVDRIGRGTLHIPALCLSIIGTIQPGKLSSYVSGALGSGAGDDGLLQRFQLAVWPEITPQWINVDEWPDTGAKNRAFDLFKQLDQLPMPEGDGVQGLHFAPDAQQLFDAWRDELEARLRSSEMNDRPAFESHLAKYRSLLPSLALIFQLVENPGSDAVGLDAARNAAAWCEYLEGHARKIYSAEIHPEITAAHALAKKISTGAIEHQCTIRDVYRRQWSGLDAPETVMDALEVLSRCNWVRTGEKHNGSRPAEIIELHPELRGGK